MKETRIHFQWSEKRPHARFRAGVSLDSHTLHSRESLDFIYRIAKNCAAVGWALRRGEARYEFSGTPLDLRRGLVSSSRPPGRVRGRIRTAQFHGIGSHCCSHRS